MGHHIFNLFVHLAISCCVRLHDFQYFNFLKWWWISFDLWTQNKLSYWHVQIWYYLTSKFILADCLTDLFKICEDYIKGKNWNKQFEWSGTKIKLWYVAFNLKSMAVCVCQTEDQHCYKKYLIWLTGIYSYKFSCLVLFLAFNWQIDIDDWP